MLIGANFEFCLIKRDAMEDVFSEGAQVADNNHYTCTANGEDFFVVFKKDSINQILKITPDWNNNLDPDGGTSFMCKEVVHLIDSLVTTKTYI